MNFLTALLSALAMNSSNLSEVCYDINLNFEVLLDELDIGAQTGLVDPTFVTKYSTLLTNMAERMEEACS